jgi:hypothetical protein
MGGRPLMSPMCHTARPTWVLVRRVSKLQLGTCRPAIDWSGATSLNRDDETLLDPTRASVNNLRLTPNRDPQPLTALPKLSHQWSGMRVLATTPTGVGIDASGMPISMRRQELDRRDRIEILRARQ